MLFFVCVQARGIPVPHAVNLMKCGVGQETPWGIQLHTTCNLVSAVPYKTFKLFLLT